MKEIHEAFQALESDRILATILDFVKETEKKYQANVCKSQLHANTIIPTIKN